MIKEVTTFVTVKQGGEKEKETRSRTESVIRTRKRTEKGGGEQI